MKDQARIEEINRENERRRSVGAVIAKAESDLADLREVLRLFPDAVRDAFDDTGRIWLSWAVAAETCTHLLCLLEGRNPPLPGIVVGGLFVTRPGWPDGARVVSAEALLENVLIDLGGTEPEAFSKVVRCAAERFARADDGKGL